MRRTRSVGPVRTSNSPRHPRMGRCASMAASCVGTHCAAASLVRNSTAGSTMSCTPSTPEFYATSAMASVADHSEEPFHTPYSRMAREDCSDTAARPNRGTARKDRGGSEKYRASGA